MQSPHFDGFLSVWNKENRFKQMIERACIKIEEKSCGSLQFDMNPLYFFLGQSI
ncbi:hypothetical protein C2W59_02564 [Bacillus pumilus]|uniref:Uncharacterized protein n=1 Tax=Bacillus pumilus TaxID=1408 RepID=A0AB34QVB9_BACPU|nr:hypothetical protein BAT_0820 [Bacillus pumilus ATCC 7061]KIL19937.1 hypothetical protein B4127_3801 [Bacillus pumilus]RAP23718.1 hypothetical protein C2W59_02564 [Bacillus pumilus]